MDPIIKVGPCGSAWGSDWDEKGKTEITQIFIRRGGYQPPGKYISSIQTAYLEDGTSKLLLSDIHGGDGNFFDLVRLQKKKQWHIYIEAVFFKTPSKSFLFLEFLIIESHCPSTIL